MTECGFCHGRPVGNAATWLDGKPRPPAPCPRCGRISYADAVTDTEADSLNYLDELDRDLARVMWRPVGWTDRPERRESYRRLLARHLVETMDRLAA